MLKCVCEVQLFPKSKRFPTVSPHIQNQPAVYRHHT